MAMVTDGKAVDVLAPDAGITKNSAFVSQGWCGIAMDDASSGETLAMAVDQRVYSLNVTGLTLAVGDLLYITDAGVLSTTDTDNLFGKCVKAKDSNDIAWVKLLENRVDIS